MKNNLELQFLRKVELLELKCFHLIYCGQPTDSIPSRAANDPPVTDNCLPTVD